MPRPRRPPRGHADQGDVDGRDRGKRDATGRDRRHVQASQAARDARAEARAARRAARVERGGGTSAGLLFGGFLDPARRCSSSPASSCRRSTSTGSGRSSWWSSASSSSWRRSAVARARAQPNELTSAQRGPLIAGTWLIGLGVVFLVAAGDGPVVDRGLAAVRDPRRRRIARLDHPRPATRCARSSGRSPGRSCGSWSVCSCS